jgi:flagellar basal-body rod protein FlgC
MSAIDTSASGLSAQRRRLEVIARNLANAETTRTPQGGPYQRQLVVFSQQLEQAGGVEVAEVTTDPSPGRTIYQPGHPDADERGYVTLPNVNVMEEMVDMIGATRSYEANVTALNATKSMVRKALELGRG